MLGHTIGNVPSVTGSRHRLSRAWALAHLSLHAARTSIQNVFLEMIRCAAPLVPAESVPIRRKPRRMGQPVPQRRTRPCARLRPIMRSKTLLVLGLAAMIGA